MPDYSSQDFVTSGVDIDTYIDKVHGYNPSTRSPRQRHLDEQEMVGYEFDQYDVDEDEEDYEGGEDGEDEDEEDGNNQPQSRTTKTGADETDVIF